VTREHDRELLALGGREQTVDLGIEGRRKRALIRRGARDRLRFPQDVVVVHPILQKLIDSIAGGDEPFNAALATFELPLVEAIDRVTLRARETNRSGL
jgi:hypothetical protein